MRKHNVVPLGLAVVLFVGLLDGPAPAEEITIRTNRGIKMTGELKSVTDTGIVLIWAKQEKEYAWHELAPCSAYEVKRSRIDAKDAQAHFDLGNFCAQNRLPKLAKKEYEASVALDGSLKEKAEEAIARIASSGEKESAEEADEPAPEPDKKSAETPAQSPPEQPAAKTAEKPSPTSPAPPAETAAGKEVDTAKLLKQMLDDPAKYHEEWLKLQRMYLNEVDEKLGLKCITIETEHYILHSTMNAAATKQIGNGCEDLYKKMSKAFDVRKDDLLWAGKCVVFLFDNREQFLDFAGKVDGISGGNVGGYFAHRGRLVHIAIPRSGAEEKGFESTLIHEGAHAFLQLFREDIFIKPWIHEGVAQFFESRSFPNEPEWKVKRNIVKTGRRISLHSLRKPDTFLNMGAATMDDYYAYSWSALDFMIRANPKKFIKFIHALKAGKSEEEAIREAFGKSMEDFEKAWMAYARKSF